MTLEMTNRLVRWLARLWVGPHYFVPVGGHSWRGALGYVRAALELEEQTRTLGIESAWMITAAGTGGTLAGLMAGSYLLGSSLRPLGIDVGGLWRGFPRSVAHLASEVCARLGNPHTFIPDDVPLREGIYVGERYGVPSDMGNAAVRRLAQLEGIILDPIYTGKAFAGMIDLMAKGDLGHDEPVIFLHTGGVPALFAHPEVTGRKE